MAEGTAKTENCENMSITQRRSYFLKSGKLSDCCFLVGSEDNELVLYGHKMVLALASPVFETMFFGEMVEKKYPIRVDDVRHETFQALLEYIYNENTNISSVVVGCELFYTARKYMLPCLEEKCKEYLKKQELNAETIWPIYECAQLMEEEELIRNCTGFISTKTKEVIHDDGFLDASVKTVTNIFSLDFLSIDSELELIEAAARFAAALVLRMTADELNIGAHGTETSSQIRSIVEKIRFLTLTPNKFSECQATSLLLKDTESYAVLMNIGSSNSFVPMPKDLSTSRMRRMQIIDKNFSFVDHMARARTTGELHLKIHGFSDLKHSVLSPPFYVRNFQWQIKIETSKKRDSSGHLQTCWDFHLRCNGDDNSSSNWSCQTDASLCVWDSFEYRVLYKNLSHLFNREQKDKSFFTKDLLLWSDLKQYNKKDYYVYKDDIVTFTICISPQEPKGISLR